MPAKPANKQVASLQPAQNKTAAASSAAAPTEKPPTSAIALLSADHRKVEALFKQCEQADDDTKSQLVRQICEELIIHDMLEEEIFYPACKRAFAEQDKLKEAQVEHDGAKLLIQELLDEQADDEYRDAKIKVLQEQIRHHVAEEERSGEGVFAKAKEAGLDTQDLAARLHQRKQALLADRETLEPGEPVSFNTLSSSVEDLMPRSNERERDERGRFMSDDDDDYRRGSSMRSGGRSRYDDDNGRERDERGRFTRDDDDYRRGSRSRYDDDSGRERDERGRFMSEDDDYRRSSRSRYDDDNDRGGRSSRSRYDDGDERRGRGGWFGDSQGHSEAARQGRGRSRYDDDDDDYRGARSTRSRYDDDDDDRRGRGHGGWFGDPEGHSQAARRGRGRDDDDDDRGGRSRRGSSGTSSSRSSRSDDDDGRGWFGDSRGHAEAARRGWQHRR